MRQTVGEVENSRRRLLAEELYGLSLSLEIPITTLVIPWLTEGDPEVRLPSGLILTFSSQFRIQNVPASAPPYLWEGNTLRYGDAAIHEHVTGTVPPK